MIRKGVLVAMVILQLLVVGCRSTKHYADTPPAAWSRVVEGMKRQEAISILGQPRQRSESGGDLWYSGVLELRVEYDTMGRVTEASSRRIIEIHT
jgi:hypothetical protein